MKPLFWATTLWVLSALITGVVGDTWLRHSWRDEAEATFQRDVRAAGELVRAGPWRAPLELDPRWEAIERSFRLEIVPAHQGSPDPKPPHADAEAGSAIAPKIHFARAAAGRFRMTAEVEEVAVGDAGLFDLRFARELAPPGFSGLWWSMWGLAHSMAAIFALIVLRASQRQLSKQSSVLSPWLSALKLPRPPGEFLPPIEEVESALEPALALIAERTNRTIAELQNSNRRSDLVLGNLQEGVLAVDQNANILFANGALLRLLAIEEEVTTNRPLLEVVRIPTLAQLVETVRKESMPREDLLEYGNPAKSLRLLAKPLPLEGEQTGVLLTAWDETLLKRIEAIRRDFVANASHELKTPLAAIRAYAETLQMGALNDPQAAEQFVGNIIFQADRINGLVQGMLQLSRVQSGSGLRIEVFDVTEALEPCRAAIEAMAQAKGIAVDFQLPLTPVLIRSDRDGFQTIVSNLLSNAVRYTQEDGRIELSVRADANWLRIAVSDTGIGIHETDLERIFERFYRAEKGRSADSGGTGLGLSIVRNLVRALGGSVTASSEPERGSRFEVCLPLHDL